MKSELRLVRLVRTMSLRRAQSSTPSIATLALWPIASTLARTLELLDRHNNGSRPAMLLDDHGFGSRGIDEGDQLVRGVLRGHCLHFTTQQSVILAILLSPAILPMC